ATPRASATGAVALAVYPALIGVYGLARAFPGESSLFFGGVAMMAIGAAFACAEDDLRRAMTYSLLTQIGIAIAAIGIGSPQAIAGAASHAFATIFSYALILMALGAFVHKYGTASASALAGAGRAAPVTTALLCVGCLSAAAFPGFVAFASLAVIGDVATPYPLLTWALLIGSAAAGVHTILRPALALLTPGPAKSSESVFPMLPAMAIAAFLCLVVGLAPGWLYGMTPPLPISFNPFSGAFPGRHLSALGAGVAVYAGLRVLRIAPRERRLRVLDVDALYRGPLSGIGRWTGVVMLRLYGTWQAASAALAEWLSALAARFTRAGDRPYADAGAGAAIFVATTVIIILISAQS
ncbi:MAG: proton-conducting transporter membrane subunit, partial [Caulobacterales bacterium]